ncbi:MAG TPA: reactive intermediate/imine deaminase [Planctomycetaceae bacterium]|nr:reactive intermediate/imine deaminase [Planctomycetaceae bacterium]
MEVITTNNAPAAIGPYSQAIKTGSLLFVSGQIPLDPVSGEIVSGGVAEQTTRVLDNLQAVVEAAGTTMQNVAKVQIFLTDMQSFAEVNEIYASYFSAPFPARACVEVSALPKGVLVEMDAVVEL